MRVVDACLAIAAFTKKVRLWFLLSLFSIIISCSNGLINRIPNSISGFSVELSGSTPTRSSSTTIRITCGNANFFYVGTTRPDATSSSWTSCTDQFLSTSISLGSNTLIVWFRMDDGGEQLYGSARVLVERYASTGALLDPTPANNDGGTAAATSNGWGEQVVELSNGNIVIVDSVDDTGGADAGAVHLVHATSHAIIASFYGDNASDQLGASDSSGVSGITDLENGNFVISSPLDDVGGVTNAGSVKLVNGSTGEVIATIAGDNANDDLGDSNTSVSGITLLSNGNFVITSPNDDVGGVSNAGSVKLVNGSTGEVIATIAGDNASDALGYTFISAISGITDLGNGNFVIQSTLDDVSGVSNAGSVKLVNGSTGTVIATIAGDNASDFLGYTNTNYVSGITKLSSGNFVIQSTFDDGAVSDGGSVKLVNGSTGAVIATIAGETASDQIGFTNMTGVSGITELTNGNIVIQSSLDDWSGFTDLGSVYLLNGTTGASIAYLLGDNASDQLGFTNNAVSGITALESGDFVIQSTLDDVGAFTDAGSVKLVSGTAGTVTASIEGGASSDMMGYPGNSVSGVTELTNGNFVICSPFHDYGGGGNRGSAKLINGTTGATIATVGGDDVNDQLCNSNNSGVSGITALESGDFVIQSTLDDVLASVNSGTVKLVNGTTGAVTATIDGANSGELGNTRNAGVSGITELDNGNFVIQSYIHHSGAQPGSVYLINGTTGATITTITGGTAGDHLGYSGVTGVSGIVELSNGNFLAVSADAGGTDTGSVLLINGSTGSTISTISGDNASDRIGYSTATGFRGVRELANGDFVIISPQDNVSGVTDAGSVKTYDSSTGTEIENISGVTNSDFLGFGGITELTTGGGFLILSPYYDYINSTPTTYTDSGYIYYVDPE